METNDMMEIEKKVYITPELVEHGDFIEMTQDQVGGGYDGLGGSTGGYAPIPF